MVRHLHRSGRWKGVAKSRRHRHRTTCKDYAELDIRLSFPGALNCWIKEYCHWLCFFNNDSRPWEELKDNRQAAGCTVVWCTMYFTHFCKDIYHISFKFLPSPEGCPETSLSLPACLPACSSMEKICLLSVLAVFVTHSTINLAPPTPTGRPIYHWFMTMLQFYGACLAPGWPFHLLEGVLVYLVPTRRTWPREQREVSEMALASLKTRAKLNKNEINFHPEDGLYFDR